MATLKPDNYRLRDRYIYLLKGLGIRVGRIQEILRLGKRTVERAVEAAEKYQSTLAEQHYEAISRQRYKSLRQEVRALIFAQEERIKVGDIENPRLLLARVLSKQRNWGPEERFHIRRILATAALDEAQRVKNSKGSASEVLALCEEAKSALASARKLMKKYSFNREDVEDTDLAKLEGNQHVLWWNTIGPEGRDKLKPTEFRSYVLFYKQLAQKLNTVDAWWNYLAGASRCKDSKECDRAHEGLCKVDSGFHYRIYAPGDGISKSLKDDNDLEYFRSQTTYKHLEKEVSLLSVDDLLRKPWPADQRRLRNKKLH